LQRLVEAVAAVEFVAQFLQIDVARVQLALQLVAGLAAAEEEGEEGDKVTR
jgi:hypothetical protein